eukprot:54574_1
MALSALNVAIAVFIAQFGNHKCETIHTSTRNEFYGGMINCSSTEACTVICDQDTSCYDATIYCPSNYPCDIHCGTEFSFFSHSGACAQATFHCPTEAPCSINCAANACSDTLFTFYRRETEQRLFSGNFLMDIVISFIGFNQNWTYGSGETIQ